MERSEIYEHLMKAKKSQVADLCACLIGLLSLDMPGDTRYTQGWNDAQHCILDLCEDEMLNVNLKR